MKALMLIGIVLFSLWLGNAFLSSLDDHSKKVDACVYKNSPQDSVDKTLYDYNKCIDNH